MSYNSKYTGAEVERLLEKIGMKLSGKINLTSIDEIKAAQSALSQTNEFAFYLVTDSNGKIPSSQGCYDIPSANVKQLSLTSPNSFTNGVLALATSSVNINAVGVNVGDFVALTRVKVKVSDLTAALGINLSLSGEIEIYQYKILSMNDAKPTGHWEANAGVMGLMSPWDKGQVNKIGGIESTANNALPKNDLLPSRWEANMNNALQTGVYPWCDLGRPAGSTGHYTCIVNRTSTDDGAYNTIEQTAYGREAELGQVYKRIIFEKTDGTDTQFGEWVKVSKDANGVSSGDIVPVGHAVILPPAGIVQIEDVSSPIGFSGIATNEDGREFYIVPSYISGGCIIVCDIDYTYIINVGNDEDGNPIGTIIEKKPTKSQVYATKEELNNIGGSLNTYTFNIDTNSFPFEYTITQEEYDKILNADLLLLVNNEKSYQSANKEFINDSLEISFRDIEIGGTTTEIPIHVSYQYDGNGAKTVNVFVNKETIGVNGMITNIVNEVSSNTSVVHGLCETDLIDGAVITLDFGNLWDYPFKPYMLYIQTPTSAYTLFGPTISVDFETNLITLKFKNDYDDKTIICTIKQFEETGTISYIEIGAGGNSSVSIDVSALFTVGGTIFVGLEELAKHTLYADGATVTCMPKLDEGKVVLDRSVITYYGSGLTSRRDCAVVSGSTSSVTTLVVRSRNYDLP